jgi:ArsR family transcriptional regulator
MSLERYTPSGFAGIAAAPQEDAALAPSIAACTDMAVGFLKALSHPGRLMILCHLAGGERSVTELEALLGARQAAVSQQLARLRLEGLVITRREGKTIFYAIRDPRVLAQVRLLQEMFCDPPPEADA